MVFGEQELGGRLYLVLAGFRSRKSATRPLNRNLFVEMQGKAKKNSS